MKILILTSSYPSHHDVIHRTFMSDFAESLSMRDISVFVLCPHHKNLPYHETHHGITIIRFPYWFTSQGQQLTETGGMLSSIKKSYLAVFQIFFFCVCQYIIAIKIIKKEKIDLIHSHWIIPQGFIGSFIRLCTGVTHITSVHGTDIHLIHSLRILHPVLKFIAKYSVYITTNSRYTCRLVHNIVHKPLPQIIPMGVTMNEFIPYSHRKRDNRDKNILFVGRLIALKGVENLVIAFSQVKLKCTCCNLKIIGDGPLREHLQNVSHYYQLDDSIHFMGELRRKNLLSCYSEADMLVLPSIMINNQEEGLGVVLLEAMASGIPVIGSNTGGIADIIEDEVNGLLVPPGDSDALAKAIIRILEDTNLAETFKRAGLETVKNRFSWDIIADQFIEIYQEATM